MDTKTDERKDGGERDLAKRVASRRSQDLSALPVITVGVANGEGRKTH